MQIDTKEQNGMLVTKQQTQSSIGVERASSVSPAPRARPGAIGNSGDSCVYHWDCWNGQVVHEGWSFWN